MKLIFQDIDGPLIPGRMYVSGSRPFSPDHGSFIYDPVAVSMLHHLCNQSGAKIVFNSAHNTNPAEVMRRQAEFNGLGSLMHIRIKTDFSYDPKLSRLEAIEKFVSEVADIENWIVIDDMFVCHEGQVNVDYKIGMTLQNFNEALQMLTGASRNFTYIDGRPL